MRANERAIVDSVEVHTQEIDVDTDGRDRAENEVGVV
jgi:hypothetical protein